MNKDLKILFIPADNIEANISRSYYIAKGLAEYAEVYFVTWKDYRTVQWLGGKLSKLNTFKCFITSLFVRFKLYENKEDGFTRVKCSVFVDALIGRIIGKVNAKKMMRKHNAKTLTKLITKLNPDVLFYADASYFFPALKKTNLLQICDVQDDIDWEKLPEVIRTYEKNYKSNQLKKYNIHYIVSDSAKDSFTNQLGFFDFKVIYNGADFTELEKNYSSEIALIKEKYHLQKKYIITHIGSATWVNPVFTRKLFKEIYEFDQSIVLLLVGSMAKVDLPNVINIGMVPASESYIYYNISDLGLLLKNSIGSDFLYNAVPLKNIQYAAAKKPVISFPIQWLEKEKFNNTSIIKNEDVNEWVKEIQRVRVEFKWSEIDTTQWSEYNWDKICRTMFDEINSNIKNC